MNSDSSNLFLEEENFHHALK